MGASSHLEGKPPGTLHHRRVAVQHLVFFPFSLYSYIEHFVLKIAYIYSAALNLTIMTTCLCDLGSA
jgi:hypothetical protein